MKKNLLTIMLAFFVVFGVNAQKSSLSLSDSRDVNQKVYVNTGGDSHASTFFQKGVTFSDDFEGGDLSNFTVINGGDANGFVWEDNGGNLAPACATISYSSDAHDDWIITPAYTAEAGSYVKFQTKNQSTTFVEVFDVMLSTTGTNAADFTVTLESAVAPGTAYEEKNYDLSAYAGQTIYIGLHITTTDEWKLYLDEFEFGVPDPHDLGVTALTPSGFIETGSTVTPQVTVHNYGASDETAYTVVLNDGTSDISTVNVSTTITSGSDAVIDMDPWTPADGNYTLTATVTVTDDANAANDQMTSDVEVRAIGFGDVVMTFDADAAGCPGIETDGNFIYTAYWNTGSAGRYFDRYDMDGNFVEGFEVSGAVDIRDMAYNPNTGYFYGAAANTSLFEMDFTQGSEALVSTITAATDCRAIAYDDDDDTFWGNNWDSPLTEFDITGTATGNTMAVTSQYGAAYDNWTDPENPTIWGFSSDGGTPANTLVEYGMDGTSTGRTIDISAVPGFDAGIGGGLASYEENGVAYLLADIQQDPNLIVKIYLAATTPPVSVSDIAAQGINVFPNPSNGVFNINVENNYNLEVSDITGRVISTKTLTGNTSIELNTAGVYFLRFSNEKGSYTEKVIVK